ncbi:MAG: hypothetical protein AAGF02_20990, partial [Actinomycetota bacterium]
MTGYRTSVAGRPSHLDEGPHGVDRPLGGQPKDLIPVIVALIYNKNDNHLTLGSSCGKGGIGDVRKAIEEAIM